MSLTGRVISRFLSRLERPVLFKVVATLFVISLLVPDPIPLLDEVLLGLLTLFLGTRQQPQPPEAIDVTP